MADIKIIDLQTFEELNDADLMAVVGGTGNNGVRIQVGVLTKKTWDHPILAETLNSQHIVEISTA